MAILVKDLVSILADYPEDTVIVVASEGDNSAAVIESVNDAWLVGNVSLQENVVCLTVSTGTINKIREHEKFTFRVQGSKKIIGGDQLPPINYGYETKIDFERL